MTTGFDVNNVWIWSLTLAVSRTLLLFVSPKFEFSINVFVEDDDDGGDVVICGIDFLFVNLMEMVYFH